ncbi:hypothetical protein TNCV_2049721 [Trichonephila clavipes]|nr:hypothetical protein TNCV_2049721 [Trichonephila clavipes]
MYAAQQEKRLSTLGLEESSCSLRLKLRNTLGYDQKKVHARKQFKKGIVNILRISAIPREEERRFLNWNVLISALVVLNFCLNDVHDEETQGMNASSFPLKAAGKMEEGWERDHPRKDRYRHVSEKRGMPHDSSAEARNTIWGDEVEM